ncbi:MAG: PAS domain S-box protein [bacterium]|nr:PAS domain S-box protein [bacterium]
MAGFKLLKRVLPSVAVLVMMGLASALVWIVRDYSIVLNRLSEDVRLEGEASFLGLVEKEAQGLISLQSYLSRHDGFVEAMAATDRDALLALGQPLFKELESRRRLNYFDVIDKDRVTVVRVHQPEKYGDFRSNHCLQEAERLGTESYGLELSRQMTLALNVCAPIHDGENLLGYLQLGLEIDTIVRDLPKANSKAYLIAINKAYVARENWQASMSRLGRNSDWARHSSYVIFDETLSLTDDNLLEVISSEGSAGPLAATIKQDGGFYTAAFVPLVDSSNRQIGRLYIFGEASSIRRSFIHDLGIALMICLSVGTICLFSFSKLVGRLENKIEYELSGKQEAKMGMVRFRQFADSAGQGLGMADLDGNILYVNHALCRMLGISSPDLMVGTDMRPFYSLRVQSDMESRILPKLMETGYMDGEMEMRTTDGRLVPTIQNVSLIRDDNGIPLYFANIITDITERKRMEQALRATRDELEGRVRERTDELGRSNTELEMEIKERKLTEEVLREREHDYSILIDTSPYGIIITDMALKPQIVNRAVLKMSGYSEDEFFSKGNNEVSTPPESQTINRSMLDMLGYTEDEFRQSGLGDVGMRKTGERGGSGDLWDQGIVSFERELVRKDGMRIPVSLAAWLTRDIRGRGRSIGIFIEDITERKRVEQTIHHHAEILEETVKMRTSELEVARQEAEVANQAKSSFLANMSHEIRTPMAAIMGFTDMLLTPHLDESRQLRAIHSIRGSGEHLLSLINDILDLSKIEAGRIELIPGIHSPGEILQEVFTLLQSRADEKGVELRFDVEGGYPRTIRTDPIRLRQVLINLIGNAVKFTESGSVSLLTRLLPQGEGEAALEFEIIDTGIGIKDEDMAKLFRPFSQADVSTSRAFGGTGLGLAISKQLVHMLGGDIDVVSVPGVGSTFRFTIAVGRMDEIDTVDNVVVVSKRAEDERLKRDATSTTLRSCRILLVEDVPENQEIISFILTQSGCQVEFADNGKVGMEQALIARERGMPYDVILMDMQMPVLDGYQAATQLRQLDYTGPIVALTAHAMSDDRARCLEAGCDDYVPKPVDPDQLISVIDALFGNRDQHRQAPHPDTAITELPLPGADAESDTFDYNSLLKRCSENREFAVAMVRKFDARLDSLLDEIDATLANGSSDALSRLAHKLKGSAGNLGFSALQETARQLEAATGAEQESSNEEIILLIRNLREETTTLREVVAQIPEFNLELRES